MYACLSNEKTKIKKKILELAVLIDIVYHENVGRSVITIATGCAVFQDVWINIQNVLSSIIFRKQLNSTVIGIVRR